MGSPAATCPTTGTQTTFPEPPAPGRRFALGPARRGLDPFPPAAWGL